MLGQDVINERMPINLVCLWPKIYTLLDAEMEQIAIGFGRIWMFRLFLILLTVAGSISSSPRQVSSQIGINF